MEVEQPNNTKAQSTDQEAQKISFDGQPSKIQYAGSLTPPDIELGELTTVSWQQEESEPSDEQDVELTETKKAMDTAPVAKTRSPKRQTRTKKIRKPLNLE